jgi:hypothetical protein
MPNECGLAVRTRLFLFLQYFVSNERHNVCIHCQQLTGTGRIMRAVGRIARWRARVAYMMAGLSGEVLVVELYRGLRVASRAPNQ